MFSLPGYAIGDAWFVIHDGAAHCFFCTSPPPNADWHWDIGHAVSRDLVYSGSMPAWRWSGGREPAGIAKPCLRVPC